MHTDDDADKDPGTTPQARGRACLSALMDGDRGAADDACLRWREDASLRADWHAYHVIGEVLRSEEAACDASRDARFLARIRQRLADEPAVLAPASVSVRSRRRWMAPAAVAAGFVAVAGVVVATRMASDDAGMSAPALASRDAPAGTLRVAAGAVPAESIASSAPIALGDGGALIRNAELDRYLAAHRQYASAAPLAAPGGVVRSVAAVASPGR